MRAGPHTLSFMNYTKAYDLGEFEGRFVLSLPRASQRKAWAARTAWTAVNYSEGEADLDLKYCVLAKFCAEMLDLNRLGVPVSGRRTLIPNDDLLYAELLGSAGAGALGV